MMLAVPAFAQQSELDGAISKVAVSAIQMNYANQARQAAKKTTREAEADFDAAKAAIVTASDWLSENGESAHWGQSSKDRRAETILEHTPLMIAAERNLATATAELVAAEAVWEQKLADHDATKQAIVDYHVDTLLLEADNARALIGEARQVSRILALDLANVCNDGVPEGDKKRCDPYEGALWSGAVIEAARQQVNAN